MTTSFANLPREIGIETLEDIPVDEAYEIVRLNPRLRSLYANYLREVEDLMNEVKRNDEIPNELTNEFMIFQEHEYPIYQRQYIQDFIEKTPTHITAALIQQLLGVCNETMRNYGGYTDADGTIHDVPFSVLQNRAHIYAMQKFWKGLNIKQLRSILNSSPVEDEY